MSLLEDIKHQNGPANYTNDSSVSIKFISYHLRRFQSIKRISEFTLHTPFPCFIHEENKSCTQLKFKWLFLHFLAMYQHLFSGCNSTSYSYFRPVMHGFSNSFLLCVRINTSINKFNLCLNTIVTPASLVRLQRQISVKWFGPKFVYHC